VKENQILPVKTSRLSKSKDSPLHLPSSCYLHNTPAIVLEKEHRSIVPADREKRVIFVA